MPSGRCSTRDPNRRLIRFSVAASHPLSGGTVLAIVLVLTGRHVPAQAWSGPVQGTTPSSAPASPGSRWTPSPSPAPGHDDAGALGLRQHRALYQPGHLNRHHAARHVNDAVSRGPHGSKLRPFRTKADSSGLGPSLPHPRSVARVPIIPNGRVASLRRFAAKPYAAAPRPPVPAHRRQAQARPAPPPGGESTGP